MLPFHSHRHPNQINSSGQYVRLTVQKPVSHPVDANCCEMLLVSISTMPKYVDARSAPFATAQIKAMNSHASTCVLNIARRGLALNSMSDRIVPTTTDSANCRH